MTARDVEPELPWAPAALAEPWRALMMNTAVLLALPEKDAAWVERLQAVAARLRQLTAHDPDVALYMMLQAAGNEAQHYSAHHAMACAVVAELCTAWLQWAPAEADALLHAALSMNIGMLGLQDSLAAQASALTADQRRRVDAHPEASAELLRNAGVSEPLWLETVLRHHRPMREGEQADQGNTLQRLAMLLQRVDVFTAKLSRRKTRAAASPARAARDACLDASGHPDAIGATLLRVIGLYPPGCYVQLANGDSAVVLRRGAKAHTPLAGCLRRPDGAVLTRPQLRDTAVPAHAVRRSLLASDLKMVLNHQRVLSVLAPARVAREVPAPVC